MFQRDVKSGCCSILLSLVFVVHMLIAVIQGFAGHSGTPAVWDVIFLQTFCCCAAFQINLLVCAHKPSVHLLKEVYLVHFCPTLGYKKIGFRVESPELYNCRTHSKSKIYSTTTNIKNLRGK